MKVIDNLKGTPLGDWHLENSSPSSLNPLDVQVGGNHYKEYPIQPVEYAMANNLDLCQANVVKYVTRFREKNGLEDLEKAEHYIQILKKYHHSVGGVPIEE